MLAYYSKLGRTVMLQKMKEFFTSFTRGYFFLGMTILLFIYIFSIKFDIKDAFYGIVFDLFKSLGVTLIIVSIFSFVAESISFIEMISKRLENIVISKKFLSEISEDSKAEAFKHLIRPSEKQLQKYSNIDSWYDQYIKTTMSISKKNVRSQYHLTLKAKFCNTSGKVVTEGNAAYRLFPSEDGYNPILFGFDKEATPCSGLKDIMIYKPDGTYKVYHLEDMEDSNVEAGEAEVKSLQLNEYSQSNCQHIDIKINFKECHYDHWGILSFKALQPTDFFSLQLDCEDGISIKKSLTYDFGKHYQIDLSEDKKSIHIVCSEWLNESSGVAVIISRS